MDESRLDDLQNISGDYTETLHQVMFVLGSCDATALTIFSKYTAYWPLPQGRKAVLELHAKLIVVYIPIQVIPEIVRELGQNNTGVYQVILPDLLGLS